MPQTEGVADLEAELVAHAKAALRYRAGWEREIGRVKEILPVLRAKDRKKYKVVVLEEMIGRALDRGTISRLTAEAAGTSRKNPGPTPAET